MDKWHEKLLSDLIEESGKDFERVANLQNLRHMLKWIESCVLMLHEGHWSWNGHVVPFHSDIKDIVIERIDERRARLVVPLPIDEGVAELYRAKLGLMIVPAPLDATEALVRAVHSLAGAAIDMSEAAKLLRKSVSP